MRNMLQFAPLGIKTIIHCVCGLVSLDWADICNHFDRLKLLNSVKWEGNQCMKNMDARKKLKDTFSACSVHKKIDRLLNCYDCWKLLRRLFWCLVFRRLLPSPFRKFFVALTIHTWIDYTIYYIHTHTHAFLQKLYANVLFYLFVMMSSYFFYPM